jgi:hypothetical protein
LPHEKYTVTDLPNVQHSHKLKAVSSSNVKQSLFAHEELEKNHQSFGGTIKPQFAPIIQKAVKIDYETQMSKSRFAVKSQPKTVQITNTEDILGKYRKVTQQEAVKLVNENLMQSK